MKTVVLQTKITKNHLYVSLTPGHAICFKFLDWSKTCCMRIYLYSVMFNISADIIQPTLKNNTIEKDSFSSNFTDSNTLARVKLQSNLRYTPSTKNYRCNITHVMLISFLDTLFHGVYFLHVAGGMLLCTPLGSLMPFLCPLAVVSLSKLALYLECGCLLVICQSPSEWVELLQDIRVTFYQEMT